MKTYHIYHGESKLAEQKLKSVETQMQKVEQHTAKRTFSKKFRTYEKQSEKVSAHNKLTSREPECTNFDPALFIDE